MTPQEIAHLKTQSPVLQEALKAEMKLWHFLREGVMVLPNGACTTCEAHVETLLETPYNGPYGWCIECVLKVFQASRYEEIEYYDPYRDPKSPKYDKKYAESCENAVFCWVLTDEEHRLLEDGDEHPEMA